MFGLGNIDRVRREISRSVHSVDEALAFVQTLVETNWHEYLMQDRADCNRCGTSTPFCELTRISPNYQCCKACHENMVNGYERICVECNSVFISYNYIDYLQCPSCRQRERKEYVKLRAHLDRARALRLPATLTLEQWYEMLNYFQWKCAYCLDQPYNSFDHFVPLCKRGGTVQSNCVPACKKCNKLKHQLHPDNVTAIPREALNRVQNYLEQFSNTSKIAS